MALHQALMIISGKWSVWWFGDQANSIIYWQLRDYLMRTDLTNPRDANMAAVRRYLENTDEYASGRTV